MKLNILETHDRLEHLKEDQSSMIFQGCEDCLKKNPDSLMIQERCPYVYIFAHPRTADDGVNKRMLWQPRITRPKPQTNSYLFRATSKTDLIEVCWLIPPRELWDEYVKGNVTSSDEVIWSIRQFQNNREEMTRALPDDVSEDRAKKIWIEIAAAKEDKIRRDKMVSNLILPKPGIEEPFPFSIYQKL